MKKLLIGIFTLILIGILVIFVGRYLLEAYKMPILQKVRFENVKYFETGTFEQTKIAFAKSCYRILELKDDEMPKKLSIEFDYEAQRALCLKFLAERSEKNFNFYNFIKKHTDIYKIHKPYNDKGLYTGYYLPELEGSLTKTKKFKYPVYGLPKDEKYLDLSREDIETGKLEGKADIVAYVADNIALFFMHIQGSGKLILPDGKEIILGYAGKNKKPYTAIGKYFIEKGIFDAENISASKIMKWLADNPIRNSKILNRNESYVFFTKLESAPLTSSGVEVTDGATLAIDKNYIPMHALIFVQGQDEFSKLNNLFVAQDTGGAIKGIIRGDVYFGEGVEALKHASGMKEKGSAYIILPKSNFFK